MRQLLDELKRRNVFRVGVAYAVVGWLLIQISGEIFPTFGAPDWVPKAFIVLIALGLPIALLLAWAFEMTPEGIMKTEDVNGDESITPATGQKLNYVIAGALVLALGFIAWDKMNSGFGPTPGDGVETSKSIAVLPFANLSSDPEQEYFADGVAEEILNLLAKVEGLKVTSRSSAFSFKGQNVNIPTAAKQLGVAHVLEGSVRRAGNRVRITAQLIEAASDTHIWSEVYDRELTDIFAIQDEIAGKIAAALEIALGVDGVLRTSTEILDAYDHMLRGRFYWAQRRVLSLRQATGEFEAAIALDPDYLDAWLGLADSQIVLPIRLSDIAQGQSALTRAVEAANRALTLDPSSSQAHAVLGMARSFRNDPLGAEQLFRRAVELDPENATAHQWLGGQLTYLLQPAEAEVAYRRAMALDPRSAIVIQGYAEALVWAGEYDRAREAASRIPEFAPEFAGFWRLQAITYVLLGDTENAVAHYRRFYELSGGDADLNEEWIRRVMTVEPTDDSPLPPGLGNRFSFLIWAGRADEAVAHIEDRLAAGTSTGGPQLLTAPWVREVLGDHPKYPELMRRAGYGHLLGDNMGIE